MNAILISALFLNVTTVGAALVGNPTLGSPNGKRAKPYPKAAPFD
ncbi:hypothetical protein [Mesorhizobium sp. M1216]